MSRNALLVAAQSYDDPRLRKLRAPGQDAKSLAAVLKDPKIGAFDVTVMIDEPVQVTKGEIEGFLGDRGPSDVVFVYFACHGVKDQRGRLHFAMRDTRTDRLKATAVESDWVTELLDACRSQRILVVLDCCYSGAFAKGYAHRGDEDMQIQERFEGSGRAVITASDAMEYAWEGDDPPNRTVSRPSIFTGALVQGLATGEADSDGDGQVSPDDLYRYVFDSVRQATSDQTPTMSIMGLKGEFIVARSARGPQAAPVASETAPSPPSQAPRLQVEPRYLDFGEVEQGAKASASIRLHTSQGSVGSWSYATNGDFFEAKRKGDTLSLALRSLPGSYSGSVWIRAESGEATVDVRAHVTKGPESPREQLEALARSQVPITPTNAKHLAVLGDNLGKGERPRDISAASSGTDGLLLATDTRLIFAYRKLALGMVKSIEYGTIRAHVLTARPEAILKLTQFPAPLQPETEHAFTISEPWTGLRFLKHIREAAGYRATDAKVRITGAALDPGRVGDLFAGAANLFDTTDSGRPYAIWQLESQATPDAVLGLAQRAISTLGATPTSRGRFLDGRRPSGKPAIHIHAEVGEAAVAEAGTVLTIAAVSTDPRKRDQPEATISNLVATLQRERLDLNQLVSSELTAEIPPGPSPKEVAGKWLGYLIVLLVILAGAFSGWLSSSTP
jgi:hypothetical protein